MKLVDGGAPPEKDEDTQDFFKIFFIKIKMTCFDKNNVVSFNKCFFN